MNKKRILTMFLMVFAMILSLAVPMYANEAGFLPTSIITVNELEIEVVPEIEIQAMLLAELEIFMASLQGVASFEIYKLYTESTSNGGVWHHMVVGLSLPSGARPPESWMFNGHISGVPHSGLLDYERTESRSASTTLPGVTNFAVRYSGWVWPAGR
ncbi:MAG: hypothetical protein FWB74_01965 [Defluviitaleaceae bacterium]|nr:hypothetical protein [Defluviitaleaceae bacterium]